MPNEVVVDLADLAAALRSGILAQVQLDTETLRTTIATDIGHAIVARATVKTNKADAVHMGAFKLGWRVVQDPNGVDVVNDVPYAGVIELGRRPKRPGPPLEPIREWVERKLLGGASKALKGAKKAGGTKKTVTLTAQMQKAVRKAMRRLAKWWRGGPGNSRADVQRRLDQQVGTAGQDIDAIAEAIRWSIHIKGTKPRFILRDSLDIVPKATKAAVKRYLPTLTQSAPSSATGT